MLLKFRVPGDGRGAGARTPATGDCSPCGEQKSGAVNDLFNAGQTQRNNVMATTGALQDAYNLKMKPFMDQMDLGQYRKDGSWSNIDRLMQVAQGLGAAPRESSPTHDD